MNSIHPLLFVLFFLIVGGVASHFVTDPRWKNLIYAISAVVTGVVLLLWLLKVFGLWSAPGVF